MGISNTFATIPGIVSPALTSVIVSDQVSYIYYLNTLYGEIEGNWN